MYADPIRLYIYRIILLPMEESEVAAAAGGYSQLFDDYSLWAELMVADPKVKSSSSDAADAADTADATDATDAACCSHCGKGVSHEDGILVCDTCYTVNTRVIDNSAEWRYFGANDNRSSNPTRCSPTTEGILNSMGSSVTVTLSRGKSNSRKTPAGKRTIHAVEAEVGATPTPTTAAAAAFDVAPPANYQNSYMSARMMQRMHFWNSMTHRERSLLKVFDTLRIKASNHGISNCILEEAKFLYKKVSEGRITRGENRAAIIACSIYTACKTNSVPRSMKEIGTIFEVRPTAIARVCELFLDTIHYNLEHSRPVHFVPRFCCRLGLGSMVPICENIVNKAEALLLIEDMTPPSVVSGAIAFCCDICEEGGDDVRKDDIAEVCQVSLATLVKCYKHLMLHKHALL